MPNLSLIDPDLSGVLCTFPTGLIWSQECLALSEKVKSLLVWDLELGSTPKKKIKNQ